MRRELLEALLPTPHFQLLDKELVDEADVRKPQERLIIDQKINSALTQGYLILVPLCFGTNDRLNSSGSNGSQNYTQRGVCRGISRRHGSIRKP